MKKIILSIAILSCSLGFAQDNGYFFGGFESNSQWLLDDEGIMFDAPDDQFRANNYLQLNYTFGKFTAGVQYESYLPSALLGYAPIYDNQNGIAHYYLNYKDEKLDITGGYFYEQFGSGLIFRTWEDRQLGINNALRGVRIKANLTPDLDITALFGQQRNGFELSEGVMQGVDSNFSISNAGEALIFITGSAENYGNSFEDDDLKVVLNNFDYGWDSENSFNGFIKE